MNNNDTLTVDDSMDNAVKNKKKKVVNKKSNKIYIPHYGLQEEDIRNIVSRLNDWSELQESYSILDFCASLGVHTQRYYDWCDNYHDIGEAHKIARTRINARLIKQSLTRKIESHTVRLMRPMYHDRDIREAQQWEAKLTQEEDKKDQKIIVMVNGVQVDTKVSDNNE